MSSSKHQCCVCGCSFGVKKVRVGKDKLICPECGETMHIRPLETGLRKFLNGGSGAKQPFYGPSGGISHPQYRVKNDHPGCSRVPTCCGRAEPCDAPPCNNEICVVTLEPRTSRMQSRFHRDYRG